MIAHYDASISQPPPKPKRSLKKQTSSTPRSIESDVPLEGEAIRSVQESFYEAGFTSDDLDENPSQLSSGSFIPRSILRTASRFRKELNPDPDMEEEIIRDFRSSRTRTRAATRFVLMLMILPLLTQQISKNFLIGPIVDHFKPPEEIEIKINPPLNVKFSMS